MRVIQACGSQSWDDPEIQTLRTALGMKARHFDVILLCTKGSVLEREGIKHHLVVRSYFETEGKILRSIKKIQSLLKYFPVDVIHAHSIHDLQILVPAMQMAKSDAKLFLTTRMASAVKKRDLLHRYLYSRLKKIFATSNYIREHVIRTCPVPGGKVNVLYDGIDLDRLNPNNDHKEEIRKRLGLSLNSIVIGMVGRYTPEKGHPEFIQAAKMVMKGTEHHVQFIVLGGCPGEDYNDNPISDLSNKTIPDKDILYTGFLSDISRIMKTVDILVFPSYEESLGSTLLEAMAMEIPVVASSDGSVPEIVIDQETGLLVPPKHADALTSAMMQYIQNPALREHHAKAAKRQIQSRFDFRDYMEALIAHYAS